MSDIYPQIPDVLIDGLVKQIESLRAENEKLQAKSEFIYDELLEAKGQNGKLRAAMHDIYEVYAGSEGFIPQTCPEAYLQERVKEMAEIAAKHKRATALKETGNE